MTRLPVGSWTGNSMPIAAAIGSSMMCTSRAPAARAASRTARTSTHVMPEGTPTPMRGAPPRVFGRVPLPRARAPGPASRTARTSTDVMPEGTPTTMRGPSIFACPACAFPMRYESISLVTSKSEITPSTTGCTAMMCGGVRPNVFGLPPDRDHAPRLLVHRDHRGLIDHDAAALHVHQGVGGAEIDANVIGKHVERVVDGMSERISHSGYFFSFSLSIIAISGTCDVVQSPPERPKSSGRAGLR